MLNTCTCFIHVCVCVCEGDLRPEKSIRSRVNGFASRWSWVLGSKQEALLTAAPSPQAQICFIVGKFYLV